MDVRLLIDNSAAFLPMAALAWRSWSQHSAAPAIHSIRYRVHTIHPWHSGCCAHHSPSCNLHLDADGNSVTMLMHPMINSCGSIQSAGGFSLLVPVCDGLCRVQSSLKGATRTIVTSSRRMVFGLIRQPALCQASLVRLRSSLPFLSAVGRFTTCGCLLASYPARHKFVLWYKYAPFGTSPNSGRVHGVLSLPIPQIHHG